MRAADAFLSRSNDDGGVGTMSSPWMVRRSRSRAGALRPPPRSALWRDFAAAFAEVLRATPPRFALWRDLAAVLAERDATAVFGRAVFRRALFLAAVLADVLDFDARVALVEPRRPAFLMVRVRLARRARPVFRAAVFRAAGRDLAAAALFLLFPRPFPATAAALRLAIAVVLSVVANLDCFRVSVVKSSAYRRRKQLTYKLHPTTRNRLAVIAVGSRSLQPFDALG